MIYQSKSHDLHFLNRFYNLVSFLTFWRAIIGTFETWERWARWNVRWNSFNTHAQNFSCHHYKRSRVNNLDMKVHARNQSTTRNLIIYLRETRELCEGTLMDWCQLLTFFSFHISRSPVIHKSAIHSIIHT